MPGDAATVGFLFILGFISLGVVVFCVLRFWLVGGTLDFGPALGVLGVLLMGSAWVIKTASPLFMLLWIGVMLGGSCLIPALIENSDKRALHRIYEADIARFQRAIESGINSAGAWREIGELYLHMNRYDEAIAAFKEAIKLHPRDIEKIRRRLNLALEFRAGLPDAKTLFCVECRQETPKGERCIHCGATLERIFSDWLFQVGNISDILKPTVAIIAAVAALLTLFSAVPVIIKAILIVACVLLGGFLIWLAVEDEKR